MNEVARIHALATALLGALYLVYNGLWTGQALPPFVTPPWLVYGQLAWGLLSFAMIFVYQRVERSPVLPALFVVDTAATYSYAWYLGAAEGAVMDQSVPDWWKVLAAVMGLILFLEGVRQAKRRDAQMDDRG